MLVPSRTLNNKIFAGILGSISQLQSLKLASENLNSQSVIKCVMVAPMHIFRQKKNVNYSQNDCEAKKSLVPGYSSKVLCASLSVIIYVQNVDVIWCIQTISNNRLFCRLKLDHPPLYLAMIVR